MTMDISSIPDTTATALRYARPVRAVRCVPNGKDGNYLVSGCEVPNLESLDGVIDQGFDPTGPCGPTYWRYTKSHYYSTILTATGIFLTVTELTK
jgi:hypothetical protein